MAKPGAEQGEGIDPSIHTITQLEIVPLLEWTLNPQHDPSEQIL